MQPLRVLMRWLWPKGHSCIYSLGFSWLQVTENPTEIGLNKSTGIFVHIFFLSLEAGLTSHLSGLRVQLMSPVLHRSQTLPATMVSPGDRWTQQVQWERTPASLPTIPTKVLMDSGMGPRLLWSTCVCIPPNLHVEVLTPNVLGSGTLEQCLGHDGQALMNVIRVL